MPEFWMVRAGEGGYLAKHFERTNHVAVGFKGLGRSFREFKTFEEYAQGNCRERTGS